MADITMCSNQSCLRREKCYRAMAKPGEWQAYAEFEAHLCQYYWPMAHFTGDWENDAYPVPAGAE